MEDGTCTHKRLLFLQFPSATGSLKRHDSSHHTAGRVLKAPPTPTLPTNPDFRSRLNCACELQWANMAEEQHCEDSDYICANNHNRSNNINNNNKHWHNKLCASSRWRTATQSKFHASIFSGRLVKNHNFMPASSVPWVCSIRGLSWQSRKYFQHIPIIHEWYQNISTTVFVHFIARSIILSNKSVLGWIYQVRVLCPTRVTFPCLQKVQHVILANPQNNKNKAGRSIPKAIIFSPSIAHPI